MPPSLHALKKGTWSLARSRESDSWTTAQPTHHHNALPRHEHGRSRASDDRHGASRIVNAVLGECLAAQQLLVNGELVGGGE
jgi:hypothetical protein